MIRPQNAYGGQPRRGAAIIFAIGVLGALMVFTLTTTKYLTSARRIAENRFDRVQAHWLARAGIEMAAARILLKPDGYEGENLQLIPDSLVQLTITKDAQSEDTYRIVSDARFGMSRPATARWIITRTIRRSSESGTTRIEFKSELAP